ncbi:MAG: hypothetical protein NVS9B3_03510 [Gemmatimonadaceae bacterium]
MSVTLDDLRHVAGLARLGLDERDAPALLGQLNAILRHMEILRTLDTAGVTGAEGGGGGATPLRPDRGPPQPLRRDREAFAPAMRDGFFLVPRLDTHEDSVDALDAPAETDG